MAESKVDEDKRETVGERAREIEKLVELNQVELKLIRENVEDLQLQKLWRCIYLP